MRPGMSVNSADDSARLDYEDWLDNVAKRGLTEINECETISVECTVLSHITCARGFCKCPCHVVHNA